MMESLIIKGLPVGTTLAFCMSTVAASFPEFIMLKQVMTFRLLAMIFVILLANFMVESIERVAQELGESFEVVKVTDPSKIMEYQVMSTPAVAVEGKVVHSGSIPDHAKIVGWLKT